MISFRSTVAKGVALSLLFANGGCRNPDNSEETMVSNQQPDSATAECNTTLPPAGTAVVTPAIANSGLPCSLAFDGKNLSPDLANLQLAFDFNSWLTFVALNKMVDGKADWEGWQDLESLMLPDGAKPPPFGQSVTAPTICTGGAKNAPVLRMISKTPTTPTASISGEPLNTGPLIDQNGRYARYQILVNQPMYDYIVKNGLYSKAGQAAFDDPITFPEGTTDKLSGTAGAIVVKVSWKILGANDDRSQFHAVEGYVYSPAAQGKPETCVVETLGLVAMHIVHKTKDQPQWLWGSFEHLRNVPDSPVTSGHYNFFNPACPNCLINAQPPQPWNPAVEPFPAGFKSQIVRKTTYPDQAIASAKRWNSQFQSALAGNVLINYKLITTQWPTDAASKTDPNGAPFPRFAANSTMETYIQGNVPQASSSCIGCHGNATSTNGKFSDFSFVLEKAQ